MAREKLDHETIEEPGLLDLAGMAGAGQDLHLATGDALLQRERPGCELSSLPVRMIVGHSICA